MECLLDSGYVDSLGVCDLDKNTLEKLYEWARVRNNTFLNDKLKFVLSGPCIVLPICSEKIIDDFALSQYHSPAGF